VGGDMSGTRSIVRVGAVAAGLAGLALTVPTMAASNGNGEKQESKASAEKCCEVDADASGATVSGGGAPVTLDAEVTRTGKGCNPTRRTVSVALEGLRARHVRVERVTAGVPLVLVETSADDTVTAIDPLADATLICGDATATARYRVAFADEAPTGEARLEVVVRTPAGKLLGSATETVVLAGAVALPPEPPAPPADEDEEIEPTQTPTETPPQTPPEAPATSEPSESPEPVETTEAPAYEESQGPTGGGEDPAVAEPPALSQSGQLADGPSAPVIGAGLALAALAVLAAGTLGWWYRRRTPGAPATPGVPADPDGPTIAVQSAP
jgi:cell wall-associated NlpC family hydrolase